MREACRSSGSRRTSVQSEASSSGERQRQHHHARRREPVDRPPAEGAADQAGRGAGEKDPGQHPAHDEADDPPPLSRGGQVGGQRDRDVRDHAEDADGQAGEREPRGARGQRGAGQRRRGGEHERQDEPPALHRISERDEEEEAERVPHLREDGHPGNGPGTDPEGPSHLRKERLGVIQVRHGGGGRGGEEQNEPRSDPWLPGTPFAENVMRAGAG
jgi:hypothetical protein